LGSIPEFRLPCAVLVAVGWILPLLAGTALPLGLAPHQVEAVWRAWACPCLLAAGAVILASEFPERRWPGRFDYVGASHQIWHVCTGVCMVVWADAVLLLHQEEAPPAPPAPAPP
ncbi:MAG: hemolysin III family protein, partial [Planctomycetota bacterium]|nr:hemolysin III family protein [Planctomycetota bacterium]